MTKPAEATTKRPISRHAPEMLRSLLLNLVPRVKARGSVDLFVRYNPLLSRRIRDAMRQFRDASPQQRADLTDAHTARIQHAARTTRYGSAQPDRFDDWPVLEKQTVVEATRDFLALWPLLRVPAGTGGTTGVPLKLWRSLESIVAEQHFIDDILTAYGVSMRSKIAVLRGDNVKPPEDTTPPYGRISHSGNRLTLSGPHVNPQTIPWYHEALQRFAPSILWVYPIAAINLLSLLERANLHLTIPVILASSEILPPSAHTALEHYFGGKVVNYYGQAERVCFAYSLRPNEFFFNPCYGRAELMTVVHDRSNGERMARIIGTGYWNAAMPLIRYDTGDLLDIPANYGERELAEITLGLRAFTGIGGRDGEYVLTGDGVRISGAALSFVPREVEHVFRTQLVQPDCETVLIHVLPRPGFSTRDAARLREQARAKLPPSIHVQVEVVERLRTTSRGKTPFVIRTFSASS